MSPAAMPRVVAAIPAAGPAEKRGSDRRGAMRPDRLVSPRKRLEASTVGLGYRALEAATVVILAVAVAAQAYPQGLLSASVAEVLPLVVGAVLLITALGWSCPSKTSLREPLHRSLAPVLAALVVAGAGVWGLLAALPFGQDSRSVWAWFALSAAAVVFWRAAWRHRIVRLRRSGVLTPNVVIVGATANAEHLIEQARRTGEAAILGVFDDRAGRAPTHIAGVPVLGHTSGMLDHRVMPYVDRVVITVPSTAQGRVRELIERLSVLPNQVALFLDLDGQTSPSAMLSRLADAPLAHVSGHSVDLKRAFSKRLQDIVVGGLALLLATPVMLIVAIAVKLDSPGPLFFRQRRHGFNNEEILIWKFRSMRHQAASGDAMRQVSAGDDRVTRVGRIIRKTSLDELPQLFHVIRGEMSLVGPRPHAIGMRTGDQESARLVAEYAHRHRMKPGVTGWAAIHGSRGPVDTPQSVRRRVALDVEYIERQSFWLDLYILLMTVPCLLGDRAAVR
jgi:polysaccharide biosynthesis protein PslA